MSGKLINVFILFMVLAAPAAVQAATYDLKEMTPQVRQALTGRQNRYERLQELKAQQAVGENNRGYVEVKGAGANAGYVVAEENEDRRAIYQAIAQQNNLGAAGISTVETVFAEVQREKSRPGDLVQQPSGQWTQA